MAQVTPRTNAIFVGLEADPPMGQPQWIPVDPLNANSAFQDAVDSLPNAGGVLYVMPAKRVAGQTADQYEFQGLVRIPALSQPTKSNVTIQFAGGAVVTFSPNAPTLSDLFYVLSPGTRFSGLPVRFIITNLNNPAGRACVRIEADDVSLLDCMFDLKQDTGLNVAIEDFACVRASIQAPNILHNLKILRTTFVFQPGTQQTTPWDPNNPTLHRGVCGVRGFRVRGFILAESCFRSGSATAKGDCGPAIYLDAVEECSLSTLILRSLRTSTGVVGTDARGTLIRLAATELEGHHTVFSASVINSVDTAYVIWLEKNRFNYLGCNIIDEIMPACYAVIRATNGDVLGVVGNIVTRIQGPAGPLAGTGVIVLDNMSNATLSGGVLAEITNMEKTVNVISGSSANLHVSPQQVIVPAP